MKTKQVAGAAGALLAVTLGGCGFDSTTCEGAACDETLGHTMEPSLALGNLVPWPNPNGRIELCFTRDAGNTLGADFNTAADHVYATLNTTWGNVPGLDFIEVGICRTDTLKIELGFGAGDSGVCGWGKGASCAIGVNPANLAAADGTIVHEVGHGLGLVHEHQHPLAASLCPVEQNILDGCTQCVSGTCSASDCGKCFGVPANSSLAVSSTDRTSAQQLLAGGNTACQSCAQGTCLVGACPDGTCSPSDSYWACFGAAPTTGTVTLTADNKNFAQMRVNDRTVYTDGIVLTNYDPLSIMNYCRSNNGALNDRPTEYDMLGMEMLYSADRNYGIACGGGCFATGSGLVTTSTGSVVSEWIARGSLGVPFRVGGTDVYSYSVVPLPTGVSTLGYTFVDPIGRPRSGSGTVRKSNAMFAAIAEAATTIL
jgi:hypothetical protein